MAEIPVALDARLIAGPVLIGCAAVFFLFGIFVIQCLSYIGGAPEGHKPWNYPHFLVVVVFLLEVLSVSFIMTEAWGQLVVGRASPYWRPGPTAPGTGVLNGLVGFVVQMFFAAKAWRLSVKKFEKGFAVLIALLALTQLVASCMVTAYFATQKREYSIPMDKAIIAFLSSTVACDIVITVSMILILRRYKKRTLFSATKQLLRTLTRNTVENGLVTSVCALINLIVYFARKKHQDNIHIVFQYMVGRLYAIVLLTSLNRAQITASNHNTSRSLSGNTGAAPSGQNSSINVAHSQAVSGGPLGNRSDIQSEWIDGKSRKGSTPIRFKTSTINGWSEAEESGRDNEEKSLGVYSGRR